MIAKFSIIVPCYNIETWLRQCFDSVKSQTFAEWECIAIDDGSTDATGAICDEYAAKDSRFRIIHQSNAGEGGARNAGLAAAKGEWVFFLDGDDLMASGTLALLARLTEKYPKENLIRFGLKEFEDGAQDIFLSVSAVGNSLRADSARIADISQHLDSSDYYVYATQFIYRRSLIEDMKFARYKRGADRVFIVPILCFKAASYVSIDTVLYFYRQQSGSAVHLSPSVQAMKDELSHRLDMVEALDRSGKQTRYRYSWWFDRYCVHAYQELVWNRELPPGQTASIAYGEEDRREMIDWFYHELPRIRYAHDLSRRSKFACVLYRYLRGRMGWYFVSNIYPHIATFGVRVLITFTQPFRFFRSIKRRLHKVSLHE